jgi:hypothetical protein
VGAPHRIGDLVLVERRQLGVGLLKEAKQLAERDPEPVAPERRRQRLHEALRPVRRPAAVELAKRVGPCEVDVADEAERPARAGERGLRQRRDEGRLTGARQAAEHDLGAALELPLGEQRVEPALVCAGVGRAGAEAGEHEPQAAGQEFGAGEVDARELAVASEAHRALARALLGRGAPAAAGRALAVAE